MFKNNLGIPVSILILFMMTACSAVSVTSHNIRVEMGRIKKSILRDHENIYKLKDKKIAKKGFFYIIDNNGTVVYHPSQILVGKNLSNDRGVQVILEEKNGCLIYNTGKVEIVIFYETINRSEILCYSIYAEHFDGEYPQCQLVTQEIEKDYTE